jgi:hypothetical protein
LFSIFLFKTSFQIVAKIKIQNFKHSWDNTYPLGFCVSGNLAILAEVAPSNAFFKPFSSVSNERFFTKRTLVFPASVKKN